MLSRHKEQTESSQNLEPPPFRHSPASCLVDQQKVGAEFQGQYDSFAFARAEAFSQQAYRHDVANLPPAQPRGPRCGSRTGAARSLGADHLIGHCSGDADFLEELPEEFKAVDPTQRNERAGVGNHDHGRALRSKTPVISACCPISPGASLK